MTVTITALCVIFPKSRIIGRLADGVTFSAWRDATPSVTQSVMPDVSHDDAGEWLSFAVLGQRRGISKASAERLVRRRRWRRQAANDGTVRVYVPAAALEAADRPQNDRPDVRQDARAFDAALAAVREAHAGEVAALQETITELRTDRETVRSQLAAAQTERDAVRAEAAAAQERAGALEQADAARRAQGRWARLRRAWRRE